MPNIKIDGNNSSPINNFGGYVIITGNNRGPINNSEGYVSIGKKNNKALINNSGGFIYIGNKCKNSVVINKGPDIIISQNSNDNLIANEGNITIGNNAYSTNVIMSDGILATGNVIRDNSTIILNDNSIFVFSEDINSNALIKINGTSNLMILPNLQAVTKDNKEKNAKNKIIQTYNFNITGFDYQRDSILVPKINGPYVASYSRTILKIIGKVTYKFTNITGNIPTFYVNLSIPKSVKYSYVTPSIANSSNNPPKQSQYVYNIYYFGEPPIIPSAPCFVKGTQILTNKGYVNIENLKNGDIVMAFVDGKYVEKSIKWIGKFNQKTTGIYNLYSSPIRIKKSAISDDVPNQDLLVSPIHSILFDHLLIQAIQLVNGISIYQDTTFLDVNYYHIKLDAHYIINANGVLTESYFDVFKADRDTFENGSQIEGEPFEILCQTKDVTKINSTCSAAHLALDDKQKIAPYKNILLKRAEKLNL